MSCTRTKAYGDFGSDSYNNTRILVHLRTRTLISYTPFVLHFLHKLSAILFTLLGLALFGVEVLWRQNVWMPWSQVLLTTIPTPLIATGLLYGGLSIVLSARDGHRNRTIVGSVIGVICIILFTIFAVLRLWPLS